jgi:uncharacterized protein YkwD
MRFVSLPLRLAAACGGVALLHAASLAAQSVPPNTAACLSPDESELARLANQFRQQQGLHAVPVSFSLTSVAQWHVWDLATNDPVGGSCNLHSWSAARPQTWQAVCYTADHSQATQMWNKPRQVSGGAYYSDGYEIAAGGGGALTPELALALWQASPSHRAVLLNTGIWSNFPWSAMGVGLFQGYAVIWFGTLPDPLGTMSACDADDAERVYRHGFEG